MSLRLVMGKYPALKDRFSLILQPYGSTLVDNDERIIRGSFNHISTYFLTMCDGENSYKSISESINLKYPKQSINSLISFSEELAEMGIISLSEKPTHTRLDISGSYEKMTPLYVFVELTRACNLRCSYCCNNSAVASKTELSHVDWIRAFELMKEKGTRIISISGGEPSIKEGFWEILEYATNNFYVNLLTNGYFVKSLDDKRRALISKLTSIQISMDSVSPSKHDQVRGEGSWQIAYDAIKISRALGIKVTIASTIMPNNLSEISELEDFAERMGATLGINHLKIEGRASQFKDKVDIDYYKKIEKDRRELNEKDPDKKRITVKFPCGPLGGRLDINPEGFIKPCTIPEKTLRKWSKNLVDMDKIFDLEQKEVNELNIYKELMRVAESYNNKVVNSDACGGCKNYAADCPKGCILAPYYMSKQMKCKFRGYDMTSEESHEIVYLVMERPIVDIDNVNHNLTLIKIDQGNFRQYLDFFKEINIGPRRLDDMDEAYIIKTLEDPENHMLLLKDRNQNNIGVLDYSINGKTVILDNILIRQEERKKGYATQSLKQVMFECKQKGIEKAILGVNSTNILAFETYKKLGFKQIGKSNQNWRSEWMNQTKANET